MAVRARRPSRPRRIEATSIIERRGRWYVGYIAEVPGVNVQERTLSAARESIRIALDELAEISPKQVIGPGRRIERITVVL